MSMTREEVLAKMQLVMGPLPSRKNAPLEIVEFDEG